MDFVEEKADEVEDGGGDGGEGEEGCGDDGEGVGL